MVFETANDAFLSLLRKIFSDGRRSENTLRLLNVGFTINRPELNTITVDGRKWSSKYAQREFDWYLSGNRDVSEIKKYAPIWDRMHGGDNLVNSNYGYQWMRNNQLQNVITNLKNNPHSRQEYISLYDGKEKHKYAYDTPCTLSVGFVIDDGMLNMNVNMRSNDIWYGFCNDQYCFSELQKIVAKELGLPIGWYYHHAHDLHLYEDRFGDAAKIILNLF